MCYFRFWTNVKIFLFLKIKFFKVSLSLYFFQSKVKTLFSEIKFLKTTYDFQKKTDDCQKITLGVRSIVWGHGIKADIFSKTRVIIRRRRNRRKWIWEVFWRFFVSFQYLSCRYKLFNHQLLVSLIAFCPILTVCILILLFNFIAQKNRFNSKLAEFL